MDQYRYITLGAKYAIRLCDLGPDDGLEITCSLCHHKAIIPSENLPLKEQRGFRIVAIEHRLKCAGCGKRGQVRWSVVRKAFI